MKKDYKFLDEKPALTPVRGRSRKLHSLIVAGACLSAVGIGLLSGEADAMRGQAIDQQAAPATGSAKTFTIPLPEFKSAAPLVVTDQPVTAPGHWQSVKVRKGDSLAIIFRRINRPAAEVFHLMASGKPARNLKNLKPGQKIRLRVHENSLQELVLVLSQVKSLRFVLNNKRFVSSVIEKQYERRVTQASATIRYSLFGAGQKAGLSDNKTMDLAGIFGWDIDFALDIRSGDRFTIVYEHLYINGKRVGEGNILAAEFTNRGRTFRAIRYTDPSGYSDFYTPDGRKMRKAFLRTPVAFSRISSRFSRARKHPVLNRIRAHRGVDYAAPRGTPIKATGDGRIIFRGRKGGYGKTVVIRHGNRRTTLYAHMRSFNRKARNGSRVRQGQIIGYVGSSGLATGPHLHYEFRVDGAHRNPLTVKLPTAAPLAKKYMVDFQLKTAPLLARLNNLRANPVLASNP